ncbi:MAG: glycosyltransferase family 4 protein [Geminicoccaceae bacterium]
MSALPRPAPRRLVAINRYYRPDQSATAQLLGDLLEHRAAAAARSGHGELVTAIAGRQVYGQPDARLPAFERLGGVEIRRVASTRFGRHFLPGRLIDDVTFCLLALFSLIRLLRKGDVLITKTDPPILPVFAVIAARLRGARLLVWCQDLFPETAEALGVTRKLPFVASALRAIRNLAFGKAEKIVVLDRGMAERLAYSGVDRKRIEIAANWAPDTIHPAAAASNRFRKEPGLVGRMILGYSGNLGRVHAAAQVAGLVERSIAQDDVNWVFFGGGHGMAHIRALQARLPQGRLHLLPHQPREELAHSLSLPDMHLVSLDPGCEGLALPSKIYGIVAAGRPVLFFGDPDGPTAALVRELGIGIVLPINEPEIAAARLRACLQGDIRLPSTGELRAIHDRQLCRDRALAHWSRILGGKTDPIAGRRSMEAA